MKNMEHQIISPEAGLKDVMSALNNSVHKILFAVGRTVPYLAQ